LFGSYEFTLYELDVLRQAFFKDASLLPLPVKYATPSCLENLIVVETIPMWYK